MSHLIRSGSVNFVKSEKKEDDKLIEKSAKPEEQLEQQKVEMISVDEHQTIVEKLQQQFEAELENVKKQSFDAGLNQANSDMEDKAYAKGFEQGKKEGIAAGKELQIQHESDEKTEILEAIRKQQDAFAAVLNDLNTQLSEELAVFESVGVEIVYEVLLKILGSKAASRVLIEEVLAQCLHKCISTKVVKVRVAVADYQLIIKKAIDEHVLSLLEHVEVMPDVQILPGGCIVETESGNLDARLENQLQTFKDYLVDVYTQTQKSEGDLA